MVKNNPLNPYFTVCDLQIFIHLFIYFYITILLFLLLYFIFLVFYKFIGNICRQIY